MSDGVLIVLAVLGSGVLFVVGRLWYRRRVAAKLADDLLRDVVKGKDAFRR